MAQRISTGAVTLPPGDYVHQIDTNPRRSAALITLSRTAGAPWPAGSLFSYQIDERERNGTLVPLASGTEHGGPVTGKTGTVNPPLLIRLQWAADKDKDLIQFRLTVFQTFTTAITVEFL